MLSKIISIKTKQWLQFKNCSIVELIKYIRDKGELRETQIQAIETSIDELINKI